MTDAFVWNQLEILPSERMALASREVCKRHLVSAADFRIQMMHSAGEAIRRKPLGHGIRVEKRPINSLGRCPKNAVKTDSVWHDRLTFLYALCGLWILEFR